MKDWKNVWILAEVNHGKLSPTAYELLNAGRKLADDLGARLCAGRVGRGGGYRGSPLLE